ncbi:MAG: hypothetical protein IJZ75_07880 [Clostridia bacterium]|nr:hypothetical protein [Clostridia bacterium]
MKIFKMIVFNILGLIVGVITNIIVLFITKWIFIDILGSVKWLVSLLSWPVDYDTYAFSGIIISTVCASMHLCAKVCRFGQGKFNAACIILGIYEAAVYIITLINTFSEDGFKFSLLWMVIIAVITIVTESISYATNSED